MTPALPVLASCRLAQTEGGNETCQMGRSGRGEFRARTYGTGNPRRRRGRALCAGDLGPRKGQGISGLLPGLKVHASYEALLSDPEVEAVYIPLPNHLHIDWSLKALAAGKHVLCEKPIALRAGEIDPLIAARDRSGLFATEAFMIVQHPQWQRAREWLEAGEIGQLRHVDAQFSFALPIPATSATGPRPAAAACPTSASTPSARPAG